jgi:membrane-associated protease RseP (regulator of RpoE activity)
VSAGAQAAGLQKGDELIAINGTRINEWSQVHTLIAGTQDHPAQAGDVVHLLVQRGDQLLTYNVALRPSTDGGTKRLVAGIASKVYLPHPGLFASVVEAPKQVGDIAWESVKALGSMFSPAGISNYFKILSGDKSSNVDQSQRFVSPVGFGQLANDAVRSGWVNAIGLLIAINIFIGLFNLLPLLPFDGGHIAIATYEKLASMFRGRKVQVDVAKLMPITVAVVAVLGFIFISSIFLDITRPVANPF